MIKVMIVDDSRVVRNVLSAVLSTDPDIEVVAEAEDPLVAMQAMKKMAPQKPDVIILDIEMPRMDGLTFLEKILSKDNIPIVICSTLTTQGSMKAIKAFELGAVEIINKPKVGVADFFAETAIIFLDIIKAAASAQLALTRKRHALAANKFAGNPSNKFSGHRSDIDIIAIGSSTGGPAALYSLMQTFSAKVPGFVLVQHMPEQYTASFARRLNDISELSISEAKTGDLVQPGHMLVAPGHSHMLVKSSAKGLTIEIVDGPLVNRHRPAVDVLMRSVARAAGPRAVGCIMTGMGKDGAIGLKEMRDAGAKTFAQDEDSCVVYGMPREAMAIGAVQQLVALKDLPGAILGHRY